MYLAMAIRLQPTRKARRNLALLLAAFIAFIVICAGIPLIGLHNPSSTVPVLLLAGLLPAAVMIPSLLYHRRLRRYELHGTTLVYGLTKRRLELPEVHQISVIRKAWPSAPSQQDLILRLDRVRIKFGDTLCRSYYTPESLHALADRLALSPDPKVKRHALWLHQFAQNPTVESWPPRGTLSL